MGYRVGYFGMPDFTDLPPAPRIPIIAIAVRPLGLMAYDAEGKVWIYSVFLRFPPDELLQIVFHDVDVHAREVNRRGRHMVNACTQSYLEGKQGNIQIAQ